MTNIAFPSQKTDPADGSENLEPRSVPIEELTRNSLIRDKRECRARALYRLLKREIFSR